MTEAELDAYVTEQVAAMPPLTPDVVSALGVLLALEPDGTDLADPREIASGAA